MSKMSIATKDRPKVKAECLRLLVTLKLDPAKSRLISKFVDTYLRLNVQEESTFQSEIDKMGMTQKEEIMQTMTSWEEKGMEKGMERGLDRQRSTILRQLTRKVGLMTDETIEQVNGLSFDQLENLAEALLDFTQFEDLLKWFAIDRLS